MRTYQNDGSTQYVLQNEFTAYLQTAIRRAKARYLQKKQLVLNTEFSSDTNLLSIIPPFNGGATLSLASNDVDNQAERLELTLLMAEMLEQLTEREVRILKGKVFDGFTFQEIAVHLGLDVNTVKSIYYRALKKLRGMLEI